MSGLARVGLLEAVDDPRLLAFPAHPRQRELLELISLSRTTIACCGRRFGKTRAAAAAGLHNLLLVPELDTMVSTGEKRYALSIANSLSQARIFVEHARTLVRGSPALRRELLDETDSELVFRGNRVLAAMPCTAKSTRGYAASFVCLDELAHFFDADEGGPAVAARIWASAVPSTAQFGPLGKVVALSTPLGSGGLFAELYAKARNGEIEGAAAFHAPTSANPAIDAAYLAAQEAALGYDDFEREFGAVFTAGGASFIESSRIREVVADWREALPGDAVEWVLAFDAAFSSDPAAVAVVGRSLDDPARLVCGLVQRWMPPKRRRLRRSREDETARIETVIADVAEIAARYQARCIVDQHLPGTVVTEFAKRGVHAVVRPWSAESRTRAAQAVRARIYTQRIELPDEPQLATELARLRTKYRAGSATVEVPRVGDSHCDMAVALMAAVGELDRHGGSWEAGGESEVGGERSSLLDALGTNVAPWEQGGTFGGLSPDMRL